MMGSECMWALGDGSNFQLIRGPWKLSFKVFSSRRASSLTHALDESCVDLIEVTHFPEPSFYRDPLFPFPSLSSSPTPFPVLPEAITNYSDDSVPSSTYHSDLLCHLWDTSANHLNLCVKQGSSLPVLSLLLYPTTSFLWILVTLFPPPLAPSIPQFFLPSLLCLRSPYSIWDTPTTPLPPSSFLASGSQHWFLEISCQQTTKEVELAVRHSVSMYVWCLCYVGMCGCSCVQLFH